MSAPDPSSLKYWETLSEVGCAVVIFGVCGEAFELFKRLARTESTRTRLAIVFWVILVIGLAIELLGSHQAMRIGREENAQLNFARTKLEKQIEELRAKNIQLEAQLSPRLIEQSGPVERLKILPRANAVIVSASGAEPVSMASQIATILRYAGWNVEGPVVTLAPVDSGVRVSPCSTNQLSSLQSRLFTEPHSEDQRTAIILQIASLWDQKSPQPSDEETRISKACNELVLELNNGGIDSVVDSVLSICSRKRFEGVFIVVGPKPTPDESELIKIHNKLADFNKATGQDSKAYREQFSKMIAKQAGTNSNPHGGMYGMQLGPRLLP